MHPYASLCIPMQGNLGPHVMLLQLAQAVERHGASLVAQRADIQERVSDVQEGMSDIQERARGLPGCTARRHSGAGVGAWVGGQKYVLVIEVCFLLLNTWLPLPSTVL